MPRSTLVQSIIVVCCPLGTLRVRQKRDGSRFRKPSVKSDKDNRQYQAIRLDNGMVVLLVSDPQAVKSLSALVVPVGSLEDPEAYQGAGTLP